MAAATDRLRAGVVGLGWAGQQHMDAYDAHSDVELVAIAGLEDELRARLGDEHGLSEIQRFSDYRDMIDAAQLDLISIATPTALHAPVALAALDAGVHTLSEKPMAENAVRAAEMVAAAKANDRVLDVCFNHRRRGDVRALKKIIDDGVLGEIYYAKASWLRRTGIPGLGTWFTNARLAGGGPLMDIGVHMLDIALYLMGDPVVQAVTATTYAEFGPRGRGGSMYGAGKRSDVASDGAFEVEDLATAFVRLAGGSTLLLEASWASYVPHDQFSVTLYGSEGGAVLGSPEGWGAPGLSVFTDVKGVPAELFPVLAPDGRHQETVFDFVAKVQAPDWSSYRGDTLLSRSTTVDAAYVSAKEGREITLE